MNKDTVAGNWKQLKGKVKIQWGKLTGNYIEEIEGNGVELAGKVQEGYGTARDTAEQQIESLDKQSNK